MIGPSLFIIYRSAVNRARVRLRRLREPRYLLGAIAAAVYFYFSIFRFRGTGRRFSSRRRETSGPELFTVAAGTGTTLVAVGLAAGAALGWLFPIRSGLLEFSKAEIQFLFPAPIPRRQILLHRILRSQLGLLFAAIVPAVVFPRGSAAGRVRFAIALWVLFVTMRLFFAGVTLARGRLMHPDRRTRLLAQVPFVLTVGIGLALAGVFAREFLAAPASGLPELFRRVDALTRSNAIGVLLAPFRALAAPLFAPDWFSFGVTLPAALLVLGTVGCWVLASDGAFEGASDAAVEGIELKSAAPALRYRVRSRGFTLDPVGRPEAAFLWKAATETARMMNLGLLLRVAVPIVVSVMLAGAGGALPRGVSATFAMTGLVSIVFAMLMGPQILRADLRQDLEHLELLKTWPVSPGAIIRGELLWPVSMLTVLVWGLMVMAALLAPAVFPRLPLVWRAAITATAMLIAPGLIAAQYVIHNAAALFFPAWVASGGQRPRGFDAMGQRLILLAGTWLALVLMLVPGGIAAGIIWLVLAGPLGPLTLVPAALVCTTALLAESLLATEALGPVYERLDLTDVEVSE